MTASGVAAVVDLNSEERPTMQNLRIAAGIGLMAGVCLILVSGFVVTSGREMSLILFGFASGLVAVYALERIKARHAQGREPQSAQR